jgi:hypothetical protein
MLGSARFSLPHGGTVASRQHFSSPTKIALVSFGGADSFCQLPHLARSSYNDCWWMFYVAVLSLPWTGMQGYPAPSSGRMAIPLARRITTLSLFDRASVHYYRSGLL